MLFSGHAHALAVLSFVSSAVALPALSPQTCDYTPEWQPCTGTANANGVNNFDCAAIRVAENWRGYVQGQSPEITMRLIRYRARNNPSTANSIIVNPGGPGESGINYILKGGGSGEADFSGGNFHIIGFDPRGTGLNLPYQCNTPRTFPGFNVDASGIFDQLATFYNGLASGCESQRKDIGSITDTLQTAKDVYAISKAVNADKKIRYSGYSYGTLLGNVIARLYPTEISRMKLDGNVDPNSWFFQQGAVEANDAAESFRQFFRDCAASTVQQCAWHGGTLQSYENLLKKFDDWVGADPTLPNRGRANGGLDWSQSFIIRNLMHGELKIPSNHPRLAEVIQIMYSDTSANKESIRNFCPGENLKTYTGKACPKANNKRQENSNYNPNAAGTAVVDNNLLGIKCLDNRLRPALTGTQYEQWYKDLRDVNRYSGESGMIGIYNCAAWKQQPSEAWSSAEPWTARGIDVANTILFVNSQFDTVTPQLSATNAASYYSNSAVIFTNGRGHCTPQHQSSSLNTVVLNYWTSGQVQYLGTTVTQAIRLPVESPNPFGGGLTAADIPQEKTEGENAGSAETNQAAGPATKRDLEAMFAVFETRNSRYLPRRYPYASKQKRGDPAQPDSTIDFDLCNDGNSTTTTTSVSSTSTTTSSNGTTSNTSTVSVSTTMKSNGTTSGSTTTTSSILTQPSGAWPASKYTTSDGKPTDSEWNAWALTTTKPKNPATTSRGPWTSKDGSDSWDIWTSQSDYIPVTKTVCGGIGECKTQVVAIPTKTIYVDYVNDICETGLTSKVVTVTATCASGCVSKPTGIPQGYTTTAVYCSKCAHPSTVTVTVKVVETAKASQWSNIADTTSSKPTATQWASIPADSSVRSTGTSNWAAWNTAAGGDPAKVTPAAASGTWTAWSGAGADAMSGSNKATATSDWSAWASATGSLPVAKYTGAASTTSAAYGTLFAAVFAGFFML